MNGLRGAPAVPKCFGADYDRDSGEFVLLLEDLSALRGGNVLKPDPAHVAKLLNAITSLHARYWEAAALEEARWAGNSDTRRALPSPDS